MCWGIFYSLYNRVYNRLLFTTASDSGPYVGFSSRPPPSTPKEIVTGRPSDAPRHAHPGRRFQGEAALLPDRRIASLRFLNHNLRCMGSGAEGAALCGFLSENSEWGCCKAYKYELKCPVAKSHALIRSHNQRPRTPMKS